MEGAPPFLWKCPLLSCDNEFKSARLRLVHLEETHWNTATDKESDEPLRAAQKLMLFDGDFISVIGSEDEGFVEVIVSPEVLSIMSPMWKVMFLGGRGGNFAESTQRRAVFHDDPDTMLLLFAIAHMEYSYVPKAIDFDQLYQLAIVCNTYDCAGRVKMWARDWINPHRKRQLNVKRGDPRYVMISWVFGDTKGFDVTTKSLLKYGTHTKMADTLIMSGHEIVDDITTGGYIASVLRARERLLDDLFQVCDSIISDSSTRKECSLCGSVRTCTVLRLGNFIHALKSMNLWPERPPLHEMQSLDELREAFEAIPWDFIVTRGTMYPSPTNIVSIHTVLGINRRCSDNRLDGRLADSLRPILFDLPTITIPPDHWNKLKSTASKLSLFSEDD